MTLMVVKNIVMAMMIPDMTIRALELTKPALELGRGFLVRALAVNLVPNSDTGTWLGNP